MEGVQMSLIKRSAISFVGFAFIVSTLFQIVLPNGQASAATQCIYGVYGYGYIRSGQCVKNLQYMANAITKNWGGGWACSGYNNGVPQQMSINFISNDGSFGPITKKKIEDIQRAVGCVKVDGIVGRQTWNIMCFYASSKVNDTSSIYHSGYIAALASGCKPSDSYYGPWPYSTY